MCNMYINDDEKACTTMDMCCDWNEKTQKCEGKFGNDKCNIDFPRNEGFCLRFNKEEEYIAVCKEYLSPICNFKKYFFSIK